jgi:hypothetical protein
MTMANMDHQNGIKLEEKAIHEEKDTSSPPSLLKPDGPFSPGTPSGNSNLSDAASAEKALEPVEEQKPPRDVHGIAWALVVLSILSSTFLFALDNTIVADVQPAIVERFDSITKLPWLSVAFLVAAAGTNLIWYVVRKYRCKVGIVTSMQG